VFGGISVISINRYDVGEKYLISIYIQRIDKLLNLYYSLFQSRPIEKP
jgi:hypothetical protein